MTVHEKLTALRREMARFGLHALLVPTSDEHLSEYVPDSWQRRRWLSGFTGSAGDVVVTATEAGLWTDARYFQQASAELRGTGIRLYRMHTPGVPSLEEFLGEHLAAGGTAGVDSRVISQDRLVELERALARRGRGRVALLGESLVDAVWTNRPPLSRDPARSLPPAVTGEALPSKLRRVRKEMAAVRAEALVLSALDDIAWLLNIRGADIEFNPVAVAYVLLTEDDAQIFALPEKLPATVRRTFGKHVRVRAYEEIAAACGELGRAGRRVWADSATTSAWVFRCLDGADLVTERAPVARLKARKNPVEIEGMRAAHVRDGAALVRFLAWLEKAVPKGGVTEISAAAALLGFRSREERFQGPSFRTISGYGAHGAIIHYTVTDRTNVPLRPDGLYLVDSGGHYLDGTTDVTRTVLLGKRASAAQREQFTRVLKGMIGLTTAVFPEGVRGLRLDTLARRALWDGGLDYGHGTGHGVGMYLNVHEGPQSIGLRCTGAPLEEGNVFSNEPGYYVEGEYGIRIENLIVVRKQPKLRRGDKVFFGFDTLTMCPIDTRLVDVKLLTAGERSWLDDYHRAVKRVLSPRVDRETRVWLAKACAAV